MQFNNLPPALQSYLDDYIPIIKEIGQQLYQLLEPVFAQLKVVAKNVWKELGKAGTGETLGSTFRHICVVGLNKSEILIQTENQSVLADNWQDLADETLKKHLGLIFFAPRGLDGNPVNPHLFLMGENPENPDAVEDPNSLALAEQAIGAMSLLDFCRISPAEPNTVNVLIAADVLFHWDVKDNYVLPTTPNSWTRDLEQVIKTYPRTTRFNVYTQWENDLLTSTEKLKLHRLRDLGLDFSTWLNQPTVQEKYGGYILMASLVIAAISYAAIWFRQSAVAELTDQLQVLQQQIPQGGQYTDVEKAITEQEKMFARRPLISLVVKDTARTIQKSQMEAENFEVRVLEPNDPPKQYIVTVEAKKGAYQGWLQEEPIAHALMLNSALFDAIRKPPTTTGFKLEAIVNAPTLQTKYKKYQSVNIVKTTKPSAEKPAAQSTAEGGEQ